MYSRHVSNNETDGMGRVAGSRSFEVLEVEVKPGIDSIKLLRIFWNPAFSARGFQGCCSTYPNATNRCLDRAKDDTFNLLLRIFYADGILLCTSKGIATKLPTQLQPTLLG